MRIVMARIQISALLMLSLCGFARAQEMTGPAAERARKELMDLETSKGKNLVGGASAAADWQERFCTDGEDRF